MNSGGASFPGLELWGTVKVLRRAFREHLACAQAVHSLAADVVRTPEGTPPGFEVDVGDMPVSLRSVRRNLFSMLFFAVFLLLDIAPERRAVYGKLNQLFRIWVTSADNLLDSEDKLSLPVRMAGESRVMRQVVALMASDRVLARVLDEAVESGVIRRDQARALSDRSLQILLPSAAQEASEEGGIRERPRPEYVLSTIHVLKTGILFNIPFLGPETVEERIDMARMRRLKSALLDFGVGCQLLDDVRDMARDYREKRHNYVLSLLQWADARYLHGLRAREFDSDYRLYREVPSAVMPTVQRALGMLRGSLGTLGEMGLGVAPEQAGTMAAGMLDVLDLGDLQHG
jgi:hypothetical protein